MWKVCVKEPYMNVEKIFPTQQKDVGKIIRVWKEDENIRKIIIFGSSVTSACNPWSDIDIYVEMQEKKKRPAVGIKEVPLDIWTNYDVDEELRKEIMEKGVVVYERDFA